ncbi:MAG: hypothetical protein AAB074_17905 [Planctomycetota bacterium]
MPLTQAKALMNAIEDHFAAKHVLRTIRQCFEEADIDMGESTPKVGVGERRTLVRGYFQTVRLDSPSHTEKLLRLMELVLNRPEGRSDEGFRLRLTNLLSKDGFSMAVDGEVVRLVPPTAGPGRGTEALTTPSPDAEVDAKLPSIVTQGKEEEASPAGDSASTSAGAKNKTDDDPEFIEDPVYDVIGMEWHDPKLPKLKSVPLPVGNTQKPVDLVLMCATDTELKQILRLLRPDPPARLIQKIASGPETYFLGRFGAFRTAVTMCTMGSGGPSGSTHTARSALELWEPTALVLLGIAFGADRKRHQPADVLVASHLVPYEGERVGEVRIPRDPIPLTGLTLLNRFRNVLNWDFARPDGSNVKFHGGRLLSGEKLVDNPAFKRELMIKYPEAIGGEMEGAGVFAAASRDKTEWIVVKGVCDWADGRKHSGYQEMAAAAASSLAELVFSDPNALNGLQQRPALATSTSTPVPRAIRRSKSRTTALDPAGLPATPSRSWLMRYQPTSPAVAPLPAQGMVLPNSEVGNSLRDDWSACRLAGERRYFLQARPVGPTTVQGLGLYSGSEVRKAFETPPLARPDGFSVGDLKTPVTLPGGGIRAVHERHCRSLQPSGLLTWSCRAGREFLSRSSNDKDGANNIHPLVLVESTYCFFLLFLNHIVPATEPRSGTWIAGVGMADLRISNPPTRLCPGVLDLEWGGLANTWQDSPTDQFWEEVESISVDPGLAAFRVLKIVYQQFGLDQRAIPYSDGTRIDPERFPKRQP